MGDMLISKGAQMTLAYLGVGLADRPMAVAALVTVCSRIESVSSRSDTVGPMNSVHRVLFKPCSGINGASRRTVCSC